MKIGTPKGHARDRTITSVPIFIIALVESLSRDEPDSLETQYITNAGISCTDDLSMDDNCG